MRHGQSTWNSEHRIQGQADPPLSPEGRQQAELLGRRLEGRRFAGFYASDLKRAFETASIVGEHVGAAPEPLEGLREIYLGQWQGLRTEELAKRFPEAWASWTDEPDWDLVPDGEGAAVFETRVAAVMDDLWTRHDRGDVLVVTHGGVIQAELHRVVGRASRGLFPFKIQNASISLFERRGGRLVIAGVNDVGHLEAMRVPGRDSG
ncbi:MAG TPA: histidine phosphatase family protein [Candidatus Sulfotelmatobacter sp.]|nr:histidine phosphatase family protein [Candidatus Sulfotelmatobacter sp.]